MNSDDFRLVSEDKTEENGWPRSRSANRSSKSRRSSTPGSARRTSPTSCRKAASTCARSRWRPVAHSRRLGRQAARAVSPALRPLPRHHGRRRRPHRGLLESLPARLSPGPVQVQEHGSLGQAHDRRPAANPARRDRRHGHALVPVAAAGRDRRAGRIREVPRRSAAKSELMLLMQHDRCRRRNDRSIMAQSGWRPGRAST